MEQAATQLRATMPSTLGALAQDGGIALDDATAHLPDEDWAALAKEFFRS
jgi:hypothetical protein